MSRELIEDRIERLLGMSFSDEGIKVETVVIPASQNIDVLAHSLLVRLVDGDQVTEWKVIDFTNEPKNIN